MEFLLNNAMLDVNTPEGMGCTPLWIAAGEGWNDLIEKLLAAGAKVHTWCRGEPR